MNDETTLAFVFWVCFGCVTYTYAIYPLIIRSLARAFGKKKPAPVLADEDLPTLSVLIAAHDEEDVIERTLGFVLALDYPERKLEVVVASDGSTDRTAAIVRRFSDGRVRLLDFPVNRGKAAVLNASFPLLSGEIVLLSDANTMIDPQAARRLVRWFERAEVRTVCGRLILTDPRSGLNVDSLYWKFETFLKQSEARLGALLGANGAIYAVRRSLFAPIPEATIVDDFLIPLAIRLRTGGEGLYDSDAVAYEETPSDIRSEFRRRIRIGAGGFQSLALLWRLLDPRRGWVAFSLFSHKVLRWVCPFLLIGLLTTNVLLASQPFYRVLLGVQVGCYVASVLPLVAPARARNVRPLRLATMFTSMNLALLIGFFVWATGLQKGTWRRTARAEASRAAEITEPMDGEIVSTPSSTWSSR